MAMIADRVDLARRGEHDTVICRLPSGWAVLGDVQILRGWCPLLPDPVVPTPIASTRGNWSRERDERSLSLPREA